MTLLIAALLCALAAYRAGRFFTQEKGPWRIAERLRERAELFKCIHCIGFWLSLLMFFMWTYLPITRWGITAAAIAGVVSIVASSVSRMETY